MEGGRRECAAEESRLHAPRDRANPRQLAMSARIACYPSARDVQETHVPVLSPTCCINSELPSSNTSYGWRVLIAALRASPTPVVQSSCLGILLAITRQNLSLVPEPDRTESIRQIARSVSVCHSYNSKAPFPIAPRSPVSRLCFFAMLPEAKTVAKKAAKRVVGHPEDPVPVVTVEHWVRNLSQDPKQDVSVPPLDYPPRRSDCVSAGH